MQIILASQSPRRKELLSEMGVDFGVVSSEFEEYFDQKRLVKDVVEELAVGKALVVARKYPDALVIGADTIVVIDDRQLGKPDSPQVAKAMLRQYRNRSHQIITAVAVVGVNINYHKVASDVATIFFDGLDEEFIEEYVATGDAYDKAGAYGIQHPLIQAHILDIQGHRDTILGLPTHVLSELLAELGIASTPLINID